MNLSETQHLNIGALVFPQIDQFDLTGPFEVLSRLPNSTFHLLWKEKAPVRDRSGLILTPETTFAESPALDLLLVPGGYGQQLLMEDEDVLSFLRAQAAQAQIVFSVCTGSLILGAAGLLQGIQATTHWASFETLKYFGAIPVDARVVVDGKYVTAAGVSAGLDGALQVAAMLRGDKAAQLIQLAIQYAPEPPFQSGSPASAPSEIVEAARAAMREITAARLATARQIQTKLRIRDR